MDIEYQLKLERTKLYLDTFFQLLLQKSSVIPVVATLAASFLVIATFNEKIVPTTSLVKVLLIVLLVVIPISLWDFLYENKKATDKVVEKLELKDEANKFLSARSFFDRLRSRSVYIYTSILTLVVVVLIGYIIGNW